MLRYQNWVYSLSGQDSLFQFFIFLNKETGVKCDCKLCHEFIIYPILKNVCDIHVAKERLFSKSVSIKGNICFWSKLFYYPFFFHKAYALVVGEILLIIYEISSQVLQLELQLWDKSMLLTLKTSSPTKPFHVPSSCGLPYLWSGATYIS